MTMDEARNKARQLVEPVITLGNLANFALLLGGGIAIYASMVSELEQSAEFRRQQPLIDRRQDEAIASVDRRYAEAIASLSREIAQARLDSSDIKGSIRAIERDVANTLRQLEAGRRRMPDTP